MSYILVLILVSQWNNVMNPVTFTFNFIKSTNHNVYRCLYRSLDLVSGTFFIKIIPIKILKNMYDTVVPEDHKKISTFSLRISGAFQKDCDIF